MDGQPSASWSWWWTACNKLIQVMSDGVLVPETLSQGLWGRFYCLAVPCSSDACPHPPRRIDHTTLLDEPTTSSSTNYLHTEHQRTHFKLLQIHISDSYLSRDLELSNISFSRPSALSLFYLSLIMPWTESLCISLSWAWNARIWFGFRFNALSSHAAAGLVLCLFASHLILAVCMPEPTYFSHPIP